jgi:hypothetical protein
MAKLSPYLFGPLPVRAINDALGLELEEGEVVMSVNAQRHAQRRHPADYARCFPHVATIIATPLYVRDDFKNHGKVELVGKPAGFPDWLLVAVEVSLDDDGRYNVASFYPISEKKVQNRRDSGNYRRALLT